MNVVQLNVQIKLLAEIATKKQQRCFKSVLFICQSYEHEFPYYRNSRIFFQNHPESNSINIKIIWCVIKGKGHPKMKLLSSFTHPQVVTEHKGRYFEERL